MTCNIDDMDNCHCLLFFFLNRFGLNLQQFKKINSQSETNECLAVSIIN